MPQSQITTLIITAAGFFGGMTRALLGKITLTAVTLNALLEVALYAGTSALVGYGVKMIIDYIRQLLGRISKSRSRHE